MASGESCQEGKREARIIAYSLNNHKPNLLYNFLLYSYRMPKVQYCIQTHYCHHEKLYDLCTSCIKASVPEFKIEAEIPNKALM